MRGHNPSDMDRLVANMQGMGMAGDAGAQGHMLDQPVAPTYTGGLTMMQIAALQV